MSMMVQSGRFGAAPPGSFEPLYSATLVSGGSGYQNYVLRAGFDRRILPPGVSKFRVRFGAAASAPIEVTLAYAGFGKGITFSAAPVQVFFGGNPGFTLASGGSIWSDEITLAYDGLENFITSIYIPLGAGSNNWRSNASPVVVGSHGGVLVDAANANSLAAPIDHASQAPNVLEFEIIPDVSDWEESFRLLSYSARNNGWIGAMFRTRFEAGVLLPTSGFTEFRLGSHNPASVSYIGNAVDTPGNFAYATTPTKLQYGGVDGMQNNQRFTQFSDPQDPSFLDLTKPILVSTANNLTQIFARSGAFAGCESRYGYVPADQMSDAGIAGYLGWVFGPVIADVR